MPTPSQPDPAPRRKGGRPAIGKPLMVRLDDDRYQALLAWCTEEGIPHLAVGVRTLIDLIPAIKTLPKD